MIIQKHGLRKKNGRITMSNIVKKTKRNVSIVLTDAEIQELIIQLISSNMRRLGNAMIRELVKDNLRKVLRRLESALERGHGMRLTLKPADYYALIAWLDNREMFDDQPLMISLEQRLRMTIEPYIDRT